MHKHIYLPGWCFEALPRCTLAKSNVHLSLLPDDGRKEVLEMVDLELAV